MLYHIRNEDLYDAFDMCPLCGPCIRQRKWEEAQQRKREGIEKRKKTMAAKKAAHHTRMAIVALIWELLPMPIAEEIELHVTEINASNEKKRSVDTVSLAKRRRINK
jgi:hypothetical protein